MSDLAMRALRLLPPERAHALGLRLLPLAPATKIPSEPRLRTSIGGLMLKHPIALAAGFDKNAEVVGPVLKAGFAMMECGTITLRPQHGNPRPRVFRLEQDRAVINRLGFNNRGLDEAISNLKRNVKRTAPVGANIGINKETTTPIEDYTEVLRALAPHIDYVTVNVSSPNTPGLRRLQDPAQLRPLLKALIEAREQQPQPLPVFLKVAPDLERDAELALVDCAVESGLEGLIVSNTTLDRPHDLKSPKRNESGGLSGVPLFDRSTAMLQRMARHGGDKIDFIGVGGVLSGKDAYAKIRAGAKAVQVYTALIYGGPFIVPKILQELTILLDRDGFDTLTDAVGAGLHEA